LQALHVYIEDERYLTPVKNAVEIHVHPNEVAGAGVGWCVEMQEVLSELQKSVCQIGGAGKQRPVFLLCFFNSINPGLVKIGIPDERDNEFTRWALQAHVDDIATAPPLIDRVKVMPEDGAATLKLRIFYVSLRPPFLFFSRLYAVPGRIKLTRTETMEASAVW
jgi:hypothetical protein